MNNDSNRTQPVLTENLVTPSQQRHGQAFGVEVEEGVGRRREGRSGG